MSTVAGDGSDDFADGAALSAKFHTPIDIAIGPDGALFVVDYLDHRLRKIANGQVSTVAGNDNFGIVNGKGTAAQFKNPYRIVTDPSGNCYIIDEVDTRIRKVTPDGTVSTYAGTPTQGYQDGDALTAQFKVNAEGLASDGSGNIYLGDTFNGRIRKISSSAQVSTIAGDGSEGLRNGDHGSAQFRFPGGVTCDKQGNLYIADEGNFVIRKITADGTVSTLAGSGARGVADGAGDKANFDNLWDIAADSKGNIYVIDDDMIRKVGPDGTVSTVAGSSKGYADGDGPAAKFTAPSGLAIDAADNIYVADANNNRIRKITFQ
ncbi:MAG: hypothetical protein JST68_12745 [Bacteroidetes bacterium]|nr:hypothetical protein [Bacteroidota bacterium]